MNIKFLVLVFLGIFFSCLGSSKLANFYLDISSDYLTASATFFAAFVALYLYNDWKDPFLIEKIASDQRVIRSNIRKFKHSLVNLLDHIHGGGFDIKLNNDDGYSGEYKKRLNEVLDCIDDLVSSMTDYESVLRMQHVDAVEDQLLKYDEGYQSLTNIFNTLNKYDLHKNYTTSYSYIKEQSITEKFNKDVRNLTENFYSSLSRYLQEILKN